MCAERYSNNQIEISSIEQSLLEQYFCIVGSITNDCNDSLFESIYKLEMLFDVQRNRKAIAQTFYNLFIANANRENQCLHRYLDEKTIGKNPIFSSWKAYIIHLSKSYMKNGI